VPAGLVALVFLAAAQAPRPDFERVQPGLLKLGGTLVTTWADWDLDGDPDLFVGFNGQHNRLYRNDAGSLEDVAPSLGVDDARPTRAAAWGDYDGDGDPDLLVGFAPGDAPVLRLYRNDRDRFTDVTAEAGLVRDGGAVRQPVWVDVDGDADLDLFLAFRDGPNALFRNTEGRFEDVAPALGLDDGRRSVGAVWFDADADGDLDLYVANMDGDGNGFFVNPGRQPSGAAGTGVRSDRFRDVAAEVGLAWGGRAPSQPDNGTVRPCVGDVDGDGRLDLFLANYGPNGLFLNRGDGRWEDVSAAWGVSIDGRYDTCAFADIDHDGRLDLYVNGTFTGGSQYPDYLFRATGVGFEDVTPASLRLLHADHGAAWADLDGDGDLDLALAGARPDGMHFVMRNLLDSGVAARVIFVTVATVGGRQCPGGEVRLVEPDGRVQTRIVGSGSGYDSQSDLPAHFGLASVADGAVVTIEATCPSAPGRTARRQLTVDRGTLGTRPLVLTPGASGDADGTRAVR